MSLYFINLDDRTRQLMAGRVLSGVPHVTSFAGRRAVVQGGSWAASAVDSGTPSAVHLGSMAPEARTCCAKMSVSVKLLRPSIQVTMDVG